MGSRQNLRVLPSNAPTLSDNESIHRSPSVHRSLQTSLQKCADLDRGTDCRALRVHNVEANSISLQDDQDVRECKKGILRPGSGNIGSSDKFSKPEECRSQDTHHVSSTSQVTIKASESSARNVVKSERRRRRRALETRLPLYYRSELLSPKYVAYRAKARSKGLDQPWPDHIEEAFQEALRLYPRRGRKKEILNGKQSGGNEFITNHILQRTGEFRDRKQVSSHLQVLKAKMKNNKHCASPAVIYAQNQLTLLGMSLVIAYENDQNREQSEPASRATSAGGHDSHYSQVMRSQLKSLPSSAKYDNQPQYPTIRQVDFSMILYKGGQYSVICPEDTIHKYTSIQCNIASAPRSLENLRNWRTFYPPLAEYHAKGQINCPMYLFDSNLDLMEDAPEGLASLSVQCSLDVSHGANYANWQACTRFYEEGGRPVDLAKFYQAPPGHEEAWVDLRACPSTRKSDCKLHELPLKSAWWARTFSNMVGRLSQAKATNDAQALVEEEKNTDRYLRGVSVMQEIYAFPCAGDSKAQRLAILVWKFRKVRKGEAATTTWSKLNPPASPFQVQSPTPPSEQPPLTLDTTLQSATAYNDFYQPQQPSLFADNAEDLIDAHLSDGSTPATTPPSDYTSFPSSTSTSFPSNISNSSYQPRLLQETLQYQDPVYPSSSTFGSQESQYHSQDLIHHSQDIYDSQASLYPSHQDALSHHIPPQICGWSSPQTLLYDETAAAAVAASQDFTGGKIHITYPDASDPGPQQQSPRPSEYEPHLFAPRAQMIPHHQLIQHPEQFEPHEYDYVDTEPTTDLGTLATAAVQQGELEDQCNIDWQLIASQPLQIPDLRFQEIGKNEVEVEGDVTVQEYEEWAEEVVGGMQEFDEGDEKGELGEQGVVLGEGLDGEDVGLEEQGLEGYQ
ncbi:hypothetical protein ACLMJK_008380 [Lecanora helva]